MSTSSTELALSRAEAEPAIVIQHRWVTRQHRRRCESCDETYRPLFIEIDHIVREAWAIWGAVDRMQT